MRRPMFAALLLLLFFSCNQSEYKEAKAPATNADQASPAVNANRTTTTEGADTVAAAAPPTGNPDWDRKIVKTADLSVETKSFSRFTDRLHRLIRENGGYIAQEELTRSALRVDNSVSIKVPVDRFDDLLMQIPADSDQLTDEKVSSQDVSMELVDNKSRLETKKEVRERYMDLLHQAHNMKDILTMQQEIDGIQQDMDAAAGRINFLSHAAPYSTINLKFFQTLTPNPIEPPAPEPTFLHGIKLSFLEGWRYLSTLILGLLTVWPLWLAAATGLVMWRRYQHRVIKKPA